MKLCFTASRAELGKRAARDIAGALQSRLQQRPDVRMMFAAAPSQGEMLAALRGEEGIDWKRVTAFHMDEYIGLSAAAPQSFGNWLGRTFFDHLPLAKVHLLEPGSNPEAECVRYAELMAEAPLDLVLLGIGANGHLAFNDPPADLNDPVAVKVVELDQMCREQQVQDGCFASMDEVPRTAITVTIPTLLSGAELFCCVPGRLKAQAVQAALEGPISGTCPASALRTHPRCTIYLDPESSSTIADHE